MIEELHPLIKAIEEKKCRPVLLEGYLGTASKDDSIRLYFGFNSNECVEIPNQAVIHLEAGGDHGWIKVYVDESADIIHILTRSIPAGSFTLESPMEATQQEPGAFSLRMPPTRLPPPTNATTCCRQCESTFGASAAGILLLLLRAQQESNPNRKDFLVNMALNQAAQAKSEFSACVNRCPQPLRGRSITKINDRPTFLDRFTISPITVGEYLRVICEHYLGEFICEP